MTIRQNKPTKQPMDKEIISDEWVQLGDGGVPTSAKGHEVRCDLFSIISHMNEIAAAVMFAEDPGAMKLPAAWTP